MVPVFIMMILLVYRENFNVPTRVYPLFIALMITLASFLFSWQQYVSTSSGYTIQGRYLIIPLLVLIVYGVWSASELIKNRRLLTTAGVVLILLMTQGGGFVNHLVRGDSDWTWNNTTIRRMDGVMRSVLQRVTYDPHWTGPK